MSFTLKVRCRDAALPILSVDGEAWMLTENSSTTKEIERQVTHPQSSDLNPFIFELSDSAAAWVERLVK